MSNFGCIVYNEDSSILFDSNSRLFKVVGVYNIYLPYSPVGTNINVYVPDMINDGSWYVQGIYEGLFTTISINTGYFTISWGGHTDTQDIVLVYRW